ncbi:MAG: lipid-A-disaccharide synthase [Bacteroidales bacterium]|nr:lipid-A-disaccharide synthase [Candidatus Hennigimonas equi]
MRYYIIAGEASGDLHGSNLMKGLYAEDNAAVIRYRGGELMDAVYSEHRTSDGGKAADYRDGAIMGFLKVVLKAGTVLRSLAECKEDILAFRPDVVILIDYPGFNMRIARWAHGRGLKVFYYIAPKVWASREWRVKALRKYVDKLFIVFPFEKRYFDSKGIEYVYCGNPLVDAVESSPAFSQTKDEFCAENGLEPGTETIAMLAGSRLGEVRSMMPLLKGAAAILHSKPEFSAYRFIIAGAPGRCEEDYGDYDESYIKVIFGKTQQIVHAARAAAINSGTASLEAALLGTPQVVAYKVSRIFYLIGRYLLIRCNYLSLGNLCLDKLAFRELYNPKKGTREECTPESLAAELERLVTDKEYRAAMLDDYAAIRESLGGSGASRKVAGAMIESLKGFN